MAEQQSIDSWTTYQKMVLSELERHEEKQDQLGKDLTDLRLLVANMAAVLNQNTESIKELAKQIKQYEHNAAKQNTEITLIKYKIGAAASAISTVLTFIAQIGMKWLEKGAP